MEPGLSYNEKLDWGNKTLPPKYIKLYGAFVLLLMGGYLWKFHQHNSPLAYQIAIAALGVFVFALLAVRWNKDDRMRKSLFLIMIAQCVAQAIGLFRTW